MAHDNRAMAARQQGGAIAAEAPSSNPWASAGLLKPYAGGMVREAPKVDALATISAGFKNDRGFPVVSRDGTIHVRNADRAPGLVAELARRGNTSLTIALVHNDPKDVLQQWFATYSKTRLEQRGDEHEIVIIHLKDSGKRDKDRNPIMVPERETVRRERDPDRYALLAADMKVQTSLYFALAEWDGQEPRLIFPDGLGLYRLAFTSLNSAEAIKSQLSYIASLTGGRVAGVPLELSIAYRNLAGPDGVRRDKVPIWSLVLRPPETIKLSPAVVASILQSGIEQAKSLAIAAPRPESLDLAEYEGADIDLDEARVIDGEAVAVSQRDVRRLAGGGRIADPKLWRQGLMASLGKSSLKDKENRASFIMAATHGRYDSLTTFSESCSLHEANDLAKAMIDFANQERAEAPMPAPRPQTPEGEGRIRSYEQLFGEDQEDEGAPIRERQAPARPIQVTPEVHATAVLTGAPAAPAGANEYFNLPPEPDWGSWEAEEPPRTTVLAAWGEWTEAGRRLDPKYVGPDPTTLPTDRLIVALGSIVSAVERVHAERFVEQLVDAF